MKIKKVAIVGIQGVPAHYGGFETLVENLIKHNETGVVEYSIFCSSRDMQARYKTYKGAKLLYVPLHSNGMSSIFYDFFSMLRSIRGYDTILILGVSGCIFLPFIKLFSSAKFIVNIDGLEYRRKKWSRFASWFLRISESVAVRFADTIVSDNKCIQTYVTKTYNRNSELITYGGDHVLVDVPEATQIDFLTRCGLVRNEYALTICRIEPENNLDMILETFTECTDKIVLVGNFKTHGYGMNLRQFEKYKNIIFLDAIYDIEKLYILRNNAKFYVHGHSAGGTNPSLVEAMFFGRPIFVYDVNYNRETTSNKAEYFSNKEELKYLINHVNMNGALLHQVASERYLWKNVTNQYEKIY